MSTSSTNNPSPEPRRSNDGSQLSTTRKVLLALGLIVLALTPVPWW
jgi:hypothetical protein